jgi:uncharacterized spore protein YtfJ
MEDLNIRFDRIRHAITAELNENNNVTQRGDGVSRNINYQRRALYSEIELFKMELEELIGGNEVVQAEGKEDDDEKITVKKEKKSILAGGSPFRSRSDITSPLMNRMDSLSSSNSYVDGNRSNNIGYNNTYNDAGNQSSTDRDRLLSDTTATQGGGGGGGGGTGTGINTGKYIVISEDDGDETKISSRNTSEKIQNQNLLSSSSALEGYNQKNVLQKNYFGIFSDVEHSEILRMIEECSSISGRFGLNFAHRDPKW